MVHSSKKSVLDHVTVALVEPEFPLNIGYLARAMANFGIHRLLIVSRRVISRSDMEEATRFASHGAEIVKEIKYVQSLDALKQRFQLLIGTTAIRARRKSNVTRRTTDLEDSGKIISRYLSGQKNNLRNICLVFGRDTTGLTNSELQTCDFNLTIKTGAEYNTLNISHAAAIVFYSLSHKMGEKGIRGEEDHDQIGRSTRRERERVVKLFKELAEVSDYQNFKHRKLEESLTRILGRSNPSLRELYLLMGLASKARTKIGLLESKVGRIR